MNKISRWLGIDVGSKELNLYLLSEMAEQAIFPNTQSGYKALVDWDQQQDGVPPQTRVVMEATGTYWMKVAHYLNDVGYEICVVNPRQAHYYGLGKGKRSKTDRQDARLLATMGRDQVLTIWQPVDTALAQLNQLMQRREQVLKMKAQERNRCHALQRCLAPNPLVLSQIENNITVYDEQLTQLETHVKTIIAAHPYLQQLSTYIESIKGVGWISATWLLIVTNGFSNGHTAKELASYAGLAPHPQDSGLYHGYRKTGYGCHATLRKVLTMAGRSAKVHNPLLKAFAQRLESNGKPKKLITTACARKLVFLAHTLVHKQAMFDPNYGQALPNSA